MRETGLASEVALRDHRVVDIANRYGTTGDLDFANVAVWNPTIFQQIPPQQKISFIPIVADWIGKGGKIGGLVMNDGRWFNIGSRAEYLEVHRTVLQEHWMPYYIKTGAWPERIAKSATVDPSAQLRGFSVVGEIAGSAKEPSSTTQFCGPTHKLLPKVSFMVVLSSLRRSAGIHRNSDI